MGQIISIICWYIAPSWIPAYYKLKTKLGKVFRKDVKTSLNLFNTRSGYPHQIYPTILTVSSYCKFLVK